MLDSILTLFAEKNYEVYSRPFQLNTLGIRAATTIPNRFDDEIHVFYKNGSNQWVHFIFPATTDPGTYWLQNPLSPKGTAILKQGQYKDAYQIGLHQGKYYTLVQTKPVIVFRDYDRNAILDFNNGKEEAGMFGINIHHAAENETSVEVDRSSAGCQVFARMKDFTLFMALCETHRKLYGNSFTYTLIDKRAIQRKQRMAAVKTCTVVGFCVGAATLTYKILEE